MTPKQFKKFMDRDGGCWHCGESEAVAPHHRLNRGMGGSKRRDNAANIIIVCSVLNGLMESNLVWATTGREWGFKLESWQDPHDVPVLNVVSGQWYVLDDAFGMTPCEPIGH